jgi:DNA-binding transcriptional MerR regulator
MPLSSLHDAVWSLAELVEVANSLLPDYLPKEASGRSVDEVNPRLVRHYTTLGLLPEPLKEGREARYVIEHLLHLLVVRRLLAEGFSSAAIGPVLKGRDLASLQGLLEGTVRVELVAERTTAPAAARLEFLADLRRKAGLGPVGRAPEAPAASEGVLAAALMAPPDDSAAEEGSPSAPSRRHGAGRTRANPFDDVTWSRVELFDGLELHVREDFELPATRLGDEQLVQLVRTVLLHLEQKGKGRR